jgi:hypothetical protein
VLLPEEPDTIEYLSRPRTCRIEPLSQVGVLPLEFFHSLGRDAPCSRRRVDCLHARFGLEGAASECRELVSQMPYQLLKLGQRSFVRTFVV